MKSLGLSNLISDRAKHDNGRAIGRTKADRCQHDANSHDNFRTDNCFVQLTVYQLLNDLFHGAAFIQDTDHPCYCIQITNCSQHVLDTINTEA